MHDGCATEDLHMRSEHKAKEAARETVCAPGQGAFSPLRPLRHVTPLSPALCVRPFFRLTFAMLLTGTLCAASSARSAAATNQRPLGSVAETSGAHRNGLSALTGAAVYPGDVVETDTAGALHLRLGSGQLFLSASSSVSLEQRGQLASVTLAKGSASFSLPDPLGFELQTPAGTLRGSGTHATRGQVVVFSRQQIVVTASRGDLILDNDGELHVIPEGRSYRIVIEQNSSPVMAATSDDRPRPRRKLFFFPLATGASVAALVPGNGSGVPGLF